MDLMLGNVVFDRIPTVKQDAAKRSSANASSTGGSGGFSITVSKTLPVKAVVARKRKATTQPTQPTQSEPSSPIGAQSKPTKVAIPPKQIVKPRAPEHRNHTIANENPTNVGTGSKVNAETKTNPRVAPQSRSRETKVGVAADKEVNQKCREEKTEWNTSSTKRHPKSSLLERLKQDLPKIDLPHVQPLEEQVFSEHTIEGLDIHPHSKKNINDLLNYTKLTVVQSMAIPRLMEGRDALIRAQTGSGKTLAYALPLIEQLHTARPKTSRTSGILAVVIVPTRELALQTYELMVKLLKPYTWIVSGFLCGGEKRKTEKARLRAGLNILIGTPGRFCDHIRNTQSLKLSTVRWLVLDEADRLLELGYEKDVKAIVAAIQGSASDEDEASDVPKREEPLQTVLLSATLTASVKELAGLTLTDPAYIETSEVIRKRRTAESVAGSNESHDYLINIDECVSIPSTVQQRYLVVTPKLRLVTLCGLIGSEQQKKASKSLVFMATQDLVDFHYDIFVEVLTSKHLDSDDENDEDAEGEEQQPILSNVSIFKLHGGMTQIERSSVFLKFRTAKSAVLFCTDMVARGIDIPCVDLVVQYHTPQILADYVHRVGRTARAGHTGKAVLFVEPAEVAYIKYLADKQISIREQKIDGIFVHLGQRLKCGQKTISKNKEQAAIELKHRFEQLVAQEKELFAKASKAFVSWVRYYTNFPRELRHIFAIKAIHMGHYAQCLGLRDAPTQFMRAHTGPKDEEGSSSTKLNGPSSDRLKFPRKAFQSGEKGELRRSMGAANGSNQQRNRAAAPDLADYAKRSRVLNTSEFDSGLGPVRKKAK